MKLDEVRELIRLMKEHQIDEIDIESEGERVRLRAAQTHVAAPARGAHQVAAQAGADSSAPYAEPIEDGKLGVAIKSPVVGIFYAAPSPDKPPFVAINDEVNESTVVCIIEAMKVMNEIKAEMCGRILKVLVENGHPVEYGQALFLVEPAAANV